MNIRKDKKIKALGYTLVVFGAVCLARVPTTNSRYYTASDFYNGSYYMYNVGIKKLTEGEIKDTLPVTSYDLKLPRSKIEATIPRNNALDTTENDAGKNEKYTYYLTAKDGCLLTSIDDVSLIDNDNKDGKTEGSVEFIGVEKEAFSITMTCPTASDGSASTIKFLGVDVDIKSTLETEPKVDVEEEINAEGKFTYKEYSKTISNEEQIRGEESVTISEDSNTAFNKYITWLVQAIEDKNSEYYSKRDDIKKYIEGKIKDAQGAAYNEDNLTTIYKKASTIPKIEGIDVSVNGTDYTFSFDSNIVGYAKTYNDNKNRPSNSKIYNLFFTTDDREKVESIFEYYANRYFSSKTDPEQVTKIVNYITERGGVYDVLYGSNTIGGMSKGSTKGELNISNLNTIILMANLKPNTYLIREKYISTLWIANELQQNFPAIKGIMKDEPDIADLIIYSAGDYNPGTNKYYFYDYLGRGYHKDIKYEDVRRYFIYRSKKDPTKFILIKIEPEGNTANDNYDMNMYFYYLDEAISASKGETGIFDFDPEKDEIYINIDTPSATGSDQDYKDVTKVISMLNEYLNSDTSLTPAKNIIKPKYSKYNYYNCKYEYIPKPSSDGQNTTPAKTDAPVEVNATVENQVNASVQTNDKNKGETETIEKDTSLNNPVFNEVKNVEEMTPYTVSDDIIKNIVEKETTPYTISDDVVKTN